MSDTVHDCWLPPPFAFFPFTSPPVRFRVPSHSVSALQHVKRISLHGKTPQIREIQFHAVSNNKEYEILALIGCDAALMGSYDVSGHPIGPKIKGQAGLDCLTLEHDCPERSVTNYQPRLRKIPAERRSHLHRGGSLKSNTQEALTNEMEVTLVKLTQRPEITCCRA